MAISQPVATDKLNSPDHSLMHRQVATDPAAAVQSIAVGSDNVISILAGIKFPAAQVTSSDANTLDDYEEGTWTGAFTCGTSGTITIDNSYKTGKYVKIGRQVTVTGYFQVGSVSSPVGNAQLDGLPFVCYNALGNDAACAIYTATMNATATTDMQAFINQNSSTIYIFHFAAGVSAGASPDFKAGSYIVVNATYYID